ncbi:MAG TPA: tetratricopeptide repeat protein [Candidatus Binataceae bacterium]|jgi:Tfp pilus assembly protein PilF|nr:tetratricopeptide repeat protein [Candidatus Binataceae bacterium]
MGNAVEKQRALELWNEGVRHHMRGDFERAIALYTRSIDAWPTAEAYTFRGWAYNFLGRVDEAIGECRKAIEVDPDFGNPYNDIGAYLIAKGEFDEAIPWLERAKRAARYEPRHFPYMNLGRLYAAKGMVMQAIREFEQALEIQPGEPLCEAFLSRLKATLN